VVLAKVLVVQREQAALGLVRQQQAATAPLTRVRVLAAVGQAVAATAVQVSSF
jgi:hypothetical protein